MKQDAKSRANELFQEHKHMIGVNQTEFRRTVMQTLMAEFGISLASSATHYNNAKKAAQSTGDAEVANLGRLATSSASKQVDEDGVPFNDEDCITVCEVVGEIAGRSQSFLNEEAAREKYQERLKSRIPSTWKLIKGLGPNPGEAYKLREGEIELA